MQAWIRLAAQTTCVLSIIGSMATIASYLAVKEMRHTVREILLHISVMNVISSTANFVGMFLDYNKSLCPVYHSSFNTYHHLCLWQAFFTSYGTVGSILWTLGLSVYLYYRIVSCDAGPTTRVVRLLYLVCYVLPLYISLWLLLDGWLGYAPWSPTYKGWCATVAIDRNDDRHSMEVLMTDDIWIILSALMITTLSFTTHAYLTQQVSYDKQLGSYTCIGNNVHNNYVGKPYTYVYVIKKFVRQLNPACMYITDFNCPQTLYLSR